ncbi:LOW QUALITY PROTEIN: hypothetical protein RJ641_013469 [Dillenia turbinata]|uniref:Uncharacterized protein n=1 Tax=Dillenia turbinata TaxID=194707 RepID=A0AAN8W5Y6_9MAGN
MLLGGEGGNDLRKRRRKRCVGAVEKKDSEDETQMRQEKLFESQTSNFNSFPKRVLPLLTKRFLLLFLMKELRRLKDVMEELYHNFQDHLYSIRLSFSLPSLCFTIYSS